MRRCCVCMVCGEEPTASPGKEAGSGPAFPAVLSGYGEQWEMQYQC